MSMPGVSQLGLATNAGLFIEIIDLLVSRRAITAIVPNPIALVALYVGGIAERRDRAIFRMGIDSVLVLVLHADGLALLYRMR